MDSSEDDDKPEELKPVVASEQSAALVHYDLATVFLGGLFCLAAIAALQASSAIVCSSCVRFHF
jgi:hypothetical protein